MLPLHISCSLVRGFMGISLPPDAQTVWSQLDLASCQVVSSTDVSVPLVAAHKSSALAWAAWSRPICGRSLPYQIPDLNALTIADTNPAQGVTWSEFLQRLHPKTKYFALCFVHDIKFLATNWASSSNPLATFSHSAPMVSPPWIVWLQPLSQRKEPLTNRAPASPPCS